MISRRRKFIFFVLLGLLGLSVACNKHEIDGGGIAGNGVGIDGGGRLKRLADAVASVLEGYQKDGLPGMFCRNPGAKNCTDASVCDRVKVIETNENQVKACRDFAKPRSGALAKILRETTIRAVKGPLTVPGLNFVGTRTADARVIREKNLVAIEVDEALLARTDVTDAYLESLVTHEAAHILEDSKPEEGQGDYKSTPHYQSTQVLYDTFGSAIAVDPTRRWNAYQKLVRADNPVVYYTFTESHASRIAVDSSGNENDGLYRGNTEPIDGVFPGDTGVLFKPSTAATTTAAVSGNVSGLSTKAVVTSEFWMLMTKREAPSAQIVFSFQKYNILAMFDSFGFNMLNSLVWGVEGFRGNNSNHLLEKWVHVAAVFKNGNVSENKIYINGEPMPLFWRSPAGTTSGDAITDAFRLAGSLEEDFDPRQRFPFTGALDEFALYDYELSPEQVRAHYEGLEERMITGKVTARFYNGTTRSHQFVRVPIPESCKLPQITTYVEWAYVSCGTGAGASVCPSGLASQLVHSSVENLTATSFDLGATTDSGLWVGATSPAFPLTYHIKCRL